MKGSGDPPHPLAPLPRWGEGRVETIDLSSLAPIGGKGARREGEGVFPAGETLTTSKN